LEVGHGLNVTHVKNITDVGHLVADRDTGEDKIEKQAREEFGSVTMESVLGIARKYEMQYVEDERTLNLLEPAYRPRATEYISQMKEMVEQLLKSGHAYPTKDGIYFDVTSKTLTPYGSLSGNTVENLSAGARVDINEEKKHPADFALWKFCVGVNEHHVLRWESPHGSDGKIFPEGFPGWHIECSAMSRSLLGDRIDIHTGGEDNISCVCNVCGGSSISNCNCDRNRYSGSFEEVCDPNFKRKRDFQLANQDLHNEVARLQKEVEELRKQKEINNAWEYALIKYGSALLATIPHFDLNAPS
jgi:cell division protein FtsB